MLVFLLIFLISVFYMIFYKYHDCYIFLIASFAEKYQLHNICVELNCTFLQVTTKSVSSENF